MEKEEKKTGIKLTQDSNEFELAMRFLGNEIIAIKLAAHNFNGKLLMWSMVLLLFTFIIMDVFGFSQMLGIQPVE